MQSVHVEVPEVASARLAGQLADVLIEAAHPNSLTGRLDADLSAAASAVAKPALPPSLERPYARITARAQTAFLVYLQDQQIGKAAVRDRGCQYVYDPVGTGS